METTDKTLNNLDVGCLATSDHDFSVAQLHTQALGLVYSLMKCRILGFQVHTPANWIGMSGCPPVPTNLNFENKKYQAPFILIHGPTDNTGHFYHSDGQYEFHWNVR
jgi:hypothetical protein